jgi:hypothetical protein
LFPSDLHPHYLSFISQWYCYYGSISIFVIHFHCLLLIIEITRTKWYIRLKWTERHGTSAKNGGKWERQIVLFPSWVGKFYIAAVKILFQNHSELDFTSKSIHVKWVMYSAAFFSICAKIFNSNKLI